MPKLIIDLVEKELEIIEENEQQDRDKPPELKPKYHFNLTAIKVLIYCLKTKDGITDDHIDALNKTKYEIQK